MTDAPKPASDLVGKTIERVDDKTINVLRISFTDGTKVTIIGSTIDTGPWSGLSRIAVTPA